MRHQGAMRGHSAARGRVSKSLPHIHGRRANGTLCVSRRGLWGAKPSTSSGSGQRAVPGTCMPRSAFQSQALASLGIVSSWRIGSGTTFSGVASCVDITQGRIDSPGLRWIGFLCIIPGAASRMSLPIVDLEQWDETRSGYPPAAGIV